MIHLRSPEEVEAVGRGGAIIAGFFREVVERIAPGANTGELDRLADEYIRSHEGAVPTFKGQYGFPRSVCTSVNEEVVHGIPSEKRILDEGDVVSIDVGVTLDGWIADSAWTFPVGRVAPQIEELLRVTEEALEAAIGAAEAGNHVGDVGAAVMEVVSDTPFAIIRDLVGHGVGRELHEEPQVPNIGRAGYGPLLREGMIVALEPMLSAGAETIRTLDDGWTVITSDRAASAHFEHTVAITGQGPRILTRVPESAAASSGGARSSPASDERSGGAHRSSAAS